MRTTPRLTKGQMIHQINIARAKTDPTITLRRIEGINTETGNKFVYTLPNKEADDMIDDCTKWNDIITITSDTVVRKGMF